MTVTAGTALARDEKRSAPNIMDVVSADSVGRFPDANAAEALRRIPGVSMEIDQGEGRFVVVRGIDASLNNVTINGQLVGTPAEFGTRGVSMDSVPADLISRLEVVKAVRPDMDANAIGASINIATLGAFDMPGGFLFGSLRSGYNDMSGRAPFTGSVSFGRVLGASAALGRRGRRELLAPPLRIGAVPRRRHVGQFNGFFVPQNQAFFLYDVNRRRQGVNGALEFRPAKQHALAFRVNHNRFEDTEGRQQTELDLTRGTLTNQTPTSGQFSQGRATREYRDYNQQHLINAAMLVGTHELRAPRSTGRSAPAAASGRRRSASTGSSGRRPTRFPTATTCPTPSWCESRRPRTSTRRSAYPFRRVRFREDIEREDVLSGELNLQADRHVRLAAAASGRPARRSSTRDKTQDRTNENYNAGSQAFTLADFGLGGVGPDDFFQGNFRFGPTLNLAGLQEFFDANPSRFAFDALTTQQNSRRAGLHAPTRASWPATAWCGIDFTRWNLMAGVRVEATRADYAAQRADLRRRRLHRPHRPGDGVDRLRRRAARRAPQFLSAPNLTVRAAWTNTLGRPAYADLAPISILDEVQETDGSFRRQPVDRQRRARSPTSR